MFIYLPNPAIIAATSEKKDESSKDKEETTPAEDEVLYIRTRACLSVLLAFTPFFFSSVQPPLPRYYHPHCRTRTGLSMPLSHLTLHTLLLSLRSSFGPFTPLPSLLPSSSRQHHDSFFSAFLPSVFPLFLCPFFDILLSFPSLPHPFPSLHTFCLPPSFLPSFFPSCLPTLLLP